MPFTGTSQVSPAEVRNDTRHDAQHPAARPGQARRDVHPAAAAAAVLRLPGQARHRPVHGRRQDRRTTSSRPASSTPSGLAGNQTDWINRHLVYTHGNGLVVAPANQVNASLEDTGGQGGLPVFTSIDTGTAQSRDPGGAAGRRAADLLRRADRRTTRSSAPRRARRRASTTPTPRATPTTARAACRSATSSTGWCSRCSTASATSCSTARSTTTRRSCTSGTRRTGCRRWRRG